MKKALIIAVCSFCLFQLSAQVPGYQGKRFMLKYDIGFLPNVLQPQQYTWWKFNLHHNFEIDYSITKHKSIGLTYRFLGTDIVFTKEDPYSTRATRETYDNDGQLRVHTLAFYTKFFQKRHIYLAPVGRYRKLGLAFVHGKSLDLDNTLNEAGEDYVAKFNDLMIQFQFGRTLVLFDRALVDLGGEVGIPIVTLGRLAGNPATGTNNLTSFEEDAIIRYMFVHFFQFKIGIGLLAF